MSQLELDPVLVTPLRRPETRQRRRRRARVRPADHRLRTTALTVVGAAACLFVAGKAVAFALGPVGDTWRTGAEIRSLEGQVDQQKQINARLKQDIEYLRTPAGTEQEARRRGWVKEGEVALSVVAPEPLPEEPTVDRTPIRTAAAPSISSRIQSAIDTCLAVFGGGRAR